MLEILYLLLSLIFIVFLLYVIILLLYSMLFGAPYAAVGSERLAVIMELLSPKKGEKIADLGSGDGRIVIQAAKQGAKATGYEINPVLVWISRSKVRKSGVKARIVQRSLWRVHLAEYDAITLYGTTHMMRRLENKLKRELRPGSRVVSNHFTFPTLSIKKSKNDVHLYIM